MRITQCVCWSLLVLVFSGTPALSQSTRAGSYTVLVTPQASLTRIGVDGLGSGGASVAERGLATAAFTNPANMQFTSFTAYAEFGKYATSKWAADIDYNGQFVAPSVVVLGLPLNGFSLGLSYLHQYSNRMTSAPIPVTTEAFPDGTGEFVTYERSVELHTICGSASTALNGVVSVGLTVGVNFFRHHEELWEMSITGIDKGLFIAGGIEVALEGGFTFGLSGRYNWSMTYVPEINSPFSIIDPAPIIGVRTVALQQDPVDVQFPPICEMGVAWRAVPGLTLLASTEFQNWTTALSYGENRWQIHVGGIVDAADFLALRFGFFTLSGSTPYSRDVLDQQFITGGARITAEPFTLSVAMMDSHLFKRSLSATSASPYPEAFSQTYFASGISLSL